MKFKTEWDLGLIYQGDIKKQVKKDCSIIKRAYLAFAKKYRKDKRHLKDPKALKKALEEYEKLGKNPAGERPIMYFSYRKSLNSSDNEAISELMKLSDFFTNLSNELEYFSLEIGKVPKVVQKKFLKSKDLAPFRYFLKKLFENAKHQLSEPEEKIMNLKNLTSRGMWISGFSRLLNKQTVIFEGREIPISEAGALIPSLPTDKRRILHRDLMRVFKNISDFAESEINATVTDKKVNDRLRGFKTPYESTVKAYENDLRTVKDLVAAVSKNFHIAHKFFKVKAEMLGEQKLLYADRAAKVGHTEVRIPFEDAVEKVLRAFNSADKEFGAYVEELFLKGEVDVFPKKGKTSGAFCSSSSTLPTFVLLNHVDDFRSLTTLAHEMGHALHSKYSRKQRPIYEDYTIAVAEVASTFFENLVFDNTMNEVNNKEKMVLLHDKINDDISTIFRQIACFNFEVELHERVREEGFLPKESIAQLINKHMKEYLGPLFELEEEDGYFFVNWSHIRNFFYVYSYAFGQLISDALYEMYKENKNNIKKVIKFMEAGGSESPENIFRSVGINPDKNFFEKGLKKIQKNISLLERLWIENKKTL